MLPNKLKALFFILFFILSGYSFAQTAGDFRTNGAGTIFSTAANWDTYDGATWAVAGAAPTSANGVITIAHNMISNGSPTLDQVIINAGITLTQGNANPMTIANGAGTDLDIYGVITHSAGGDIVINAGVDVVVESGGNFLDNGGNVSNGGTITVANGGAYTYAVDAGALPSCTWSAGSTCTINGTTGTLPTNMNQTFHHLIYDLASLSGTLSQTVYPTVNGNLSILDINAQNFSLTSTTGASITVGGNFLVSTADGTFKFSKDAAETFALNVGGDFTMSGSDKTNFGDVTITFNGTSTQTWTNSTSFAMDKVEYIINSAATLLLAGSLPVATGKTLTVTGTLICGTGAAPQNVTGAGSFILSNVSTAWLKITNAAAGITALGTATGNILTTTARTFNTGSSYAYIGTSAQITGTGFPATVANLTLDNTAGVTLTAGVIISDAGTLTLTTGYHNLSTFTLQLGTTAATTLTHTAGGLYSSTDNGTFKRYIPAVAVTSNSVNYYGLFPFAKSASLISKFELNTTANVTTGGFISAVPEFAGTNIDVSYADDQGTVDYIKNGRGVTFSKTIDGGTFNIQASMNTFDATGNASDMTLVTYTAVTIFHRGTYVANSGTKAYPVVGRTGIDFSLINQRFVVGTYNNAVSPLPTELISFTGEKEGKINELKWITASELNNDYFTIEKTTDGINFEIVGMENGAGNSNQCVDYTLIDYNVRNGLNYYRLIQTDFDGKYDVSNIITIDNRTDISSKEICIVTNILGQEVNESYRGVVVIIYSDGTSMKVIQ